jgi:hypothetical protein
MNHQSIWTYDYDYDYGPTRVICSYSIFCRCVWPHNGLKQSMYFVWLNPQTRGHSVQYTGFSVNNMMIKCRIARLSDVRRITYNIHVIRASGVILRPRNTRIGFPKVNIRCRSWSGQPDRPGDAPGPRIDYPNIKEWVPRVGRVILSPRIGWPESNIKTAGGFRWADANLILE